jgi:hypothetical protein
VFEDARAAATADKHYCCNKRGSVFLSEQNQKIFTPTAAAATHTILAGSVVFACVHNKKKCCVCLLLKRQQQ